MGTISNLFNSVPDTKKDWKEDWKEDGKQDWKFDWDSASGASMPAPVNTVLPVVSGDAIGPVTVGEVLSASTGTWTGEGITFSYQWRVGGVDVAGATSSTFNTTGRVVGNVVSVRVTATNGGGAVTATSLGLTLA
jgi:hypothetical protein